MFRKDPRRVALAAGPVGILAGIQITMMREVVPAVCARGNEIRPRQDNFGGPIVEPPISKQPVVDTVVHQDQQRVLARSYERNGQQVHGEIEVALAEKDRSKYQRPFSNDMKSTPERAQC